MMSDKHSAPLFESSLKGLTLSHRGKVRDIYPIDDERMLIVTTDRLSAFDVILPDPIPGKGLILTAISNFWFDHTRTLVPNHILSDPLESILSDPDDLAQARNRSIIVRRLKPLPIEAVARGYLSGSGWKDYRDTGKICGITLPEGLQLADRLPEPIFTPATKAAAGDHDENISFEETVKILGQDVAEKVRETTLSVYRYAAEYARARGIIIADTKFEFAVDDHGELVLIDEILTPDSSRFWPADSYKPGSSPPSFDKQFVRDYLETLDWDKRAPGPHLPPEVMEQTADRYREALERLTG